MYSVVVSTWRSGKFVYTTEEWVYPSGTHLTCNVTSQYNQLSPLGVSAKLSDCDHDGSGGIFHSDSVVCRVHLDIRVASTRVHWWGEWGTLLL